MQKIPKDASIGPLVSTGLIDLIATPPKQLVKITLKNPKDAYIVH